VEEKDEKFEIMLLARGSKQRQPRNPWYLYTDASNRICRTRAWFVELDESLSGNVSLSDDFKILVNDKDNTLVR